MTLGLLVVSHAPGNEQIIMIMIKKKNLQVRKAIFLQPHLLRSLLKDVLLVFTCQIK